MKASSRAEWSTCKLVECGKWMSGGTPSKSNPAFWGGTIPWISAKSLKSLKLFDSEDRVTDEGAAQVTLAPPGSLLFVVRGMSLANEFRVGVTQRAVTFNQDLRGLIPHAKIDPYYLARFLRCVQPQIMGFTENSSHGTKRLPTDLIQSLDVPLPPLAEQQRIAGILNQADAVRRKRQQALALTDQFLRATFLDLFGDPVTNPKRWPVARLDAVSNIQSGVTKGRNYNGHKTVAVPYMRVANVQDGHLVLDEIKEIEVLPDEVDRFRLLPGDVLLTEGGDFDKLGRGAVWRGEIATCIHQNHIFRVRLNPESMIPEFLSTLLGSSRGKRYFLSAAKQTTGIASINKTQLSAFPGLMPPLKLQERFRHIVRSHEKSVARFEQHACKLDHLFSTLVQRAFRGEL